MLLSLGQLAGFTSRRRTVSWFVAAVLTLTAQVALSGPAESARRAKKDRQAAPEPASASAEPAPSTLAGAIHQAVAQCTRLIEGGKHRQALPLLLKVRRQVGDPRDPRVEALLGKVALAENRPEEALTFVGPYADKRDAYDARLADCYLVAGNAYLAAGKNYQALVIFDWMAGKAAGIDLVLAAEGCGRALVAQKDYAKAVEAFDFAVRYAKRHCYTAKDVIARLEALLRRARRLADIDRYGEDFVRYRDAERLRRQQGQFKKAREVYLEVIEKWPEGPYAEASRLYGAKCLMRTGKIPQAQKELAAFRASNPYGLYRGEAALEMGRIALEHHLNPGAAKGCFLLLDTWLKEARNNEPLNIEKLAVRSAATKVTTPPRKEKRVDSWGNVKKNEIKPGQLVNRTTCPWYLDDLAEQCAMYVGFGYFVEGDKENALTWYKKILDCDPATRRLDTSGVWNDYSRLKWGAEHGYLIAYPQELRLYNERQRLPIFLGDFHYVTQDFERAAAMYADLLKGKYGFLRSGQRDYPLYALGLATYRGNWKPGGNALQEAVGIWGKVLERSDGTWTEYRAAYTIANVSRQSADEWLRARGRKLLIGLTQTQATNEFTQKARLALAMDLAKEGQREAALALLSGFKEADGKYFALAQHLIKNAGAWTPGANKEPETRK